MPIKAIDTKRMSAYLKMKLVKKMHMIDIVGNLLDKTRLSTFHKYKNIF
jgi:hypothetical protein